MHSQSFMRSKVIVNSHDPQHGPLRDILWRASQSIVSRPTLTVETKPSSGKADGRHGPNQRSRWASSRLSKRNTRSRRCTPFLTNAAAQINKISGQAQLAQKAISSTRNGLDSSKITEISF
jgi:hypothetical protein